MTRILVFVVVVGLALTLGSTASKNYKKTREDYQMWAKDFHKDTSEEGWQNWLTSWHKVEALNSHKGTTHSWEASLTKFADMSEKEFREKILMGRESDADVAVMKQKKIGEDVVGRKGIRADATSFDWRDYGAVTPVQDQGFVGTCWAFSTVANVEGQYFLSTNTSLKLSEEFLVDCDGTADYDLHHADCSIFGGWPYLAYQYLIQRGGIPSEQNLPYCAGTGECYPCMAGPVDLCGPPPYSCDRERSVNVCSSTNLDPAATIADWGAVDSDEAALTSALQSIGPLSALLDAGSLQFYKGGVWTGSMNGDASDSLLRGCSTTYLNHAVLITGYGVDSDSGLPYWSVKNSWGEEWGEDGYFRIVRGKGECGINTAVTTSIM